MDVLQVNFFDTAGGAARISWELFNEFRLRGHTCRLAVGRKLSGDPDVFEVPNERLRNRWSGYWRSAERRLVASHVRLLPGLARLLANSGEPRRWQELRQGVEDFNFPGTPCLLDGTPPLPDVLHGHVLHSGYFDLRVLPQFTSSIPTVITMHDEWMYTGHCACTLGCERWRTGCGECPDLTIYPPIRRDATAFNWKRKRDIYSSSKLYLATPCQWLMQRVSCSMLKAAVVESRVIPNGVDVSIFRPGDKKEARRQLGLDENVWISLFVGHGVTKNKFKDFAALVSTMTRLSGDLESPPHLLVCLGEEGASRQIGKNSIQFVPYQSDMTKIAQYYRASDVYLHATFADTFPTTILEAFGCGIPVIGSAVGGIAEQIEEGGTGFLVPPGDSRAMAERIRQLQKDPALVRAMGVRAAEAARSRFSLEKMVTGYLDWYGEILETAGRR